MQNTKKIKKIIILKNVKYDQINNRLIHKI